MKIFRKKVLILKEKEVKFCTLKFLKTVFFLKNYGGITSVKKERKKEKYTIFSFARMRGICGFKKMEDPFFYLIAFYYETCYNANLNNYI